MAGVFSRRDAIPSPFLCEFSRYPEALLNFSLVQVNCFPHLSMTHGAVTPCYAGSLLNLPPLA
jgi:hypothetical protein